MKNLIYISITLLLVSCYDIRKPKTPGDLIPKDKMVNIIIDMSLLNSAKGINKRTLENKGINLEQFIYDKHKIDSLQFATSNNFYAYNVEEYEAIYKRVQDSLTELKDDFTAIQKKREKARQRKDSIRRAKTKDSVFRAKKGVNPKSKDRFISTINKNKQPASATGN